MLNPKQVKCLELMIKGDMTDKDIAAAINITQKTICEWKKNHKEFQDAYNYYLAYANSDVQDDEYKQYAKARAEELKEYAIIAVAVGEGIENLFKEYRADYIVSGGQTMNPSTEDFMSEIEKSLKVDLTNQKVAVY